MKRRHLIALLEAHGVDTAFGIPGVHTIELYRALGDSGLSHITPRHEQAAGFMADGYARASGRPAACFIISGPGMTNIATAMGQALADSVPMLVISSVNTVSTLGRGQGRLHEMPHQGQTLAGVARFSHTLLDPEALPEVLARGADWTTDPAAGTVTLNGSRLAVVGTAAKSPGDISEPGLVLRVEVSPAEQRSTATGRTG